MMIHRLIPVTVYAAVFGGCSEKSIAFRNTPPSMDITSPGDDELFDLGEPIHFEALIADSQDDTTELGILWESSIDGPMDDDAADSAGLVLFDSSILSAGLHTISLQVTDLNEESATSSVTIQVGGDGPGADDAPIIFIEGPFEGQEVLQWEMLTVIAQIQDDQQPWETLTANITSSREGVLWEGNPDEAGIVQVDTDSLAVGPHTITVMALDDEGNSTTESVAIEVVADSRPNAVITAPGAGDWFWNSDMIHFEAEVVDDFTDAQDLNIRWISDLDGILGTLSASASGVATADTILTPGYHLITLAVDDEDGNMTEETINLEIRDPMAHDGDLDGYSELAGDCDDADPYTSPGAEEVCDAYDNDCDGEINEDFADEFEPSDSKEASYDMGTVDGDAGFMGIGGGTDESSLGMTLHSADDEDWVYFDADDDWFDSPNLRVEVGMFSAAGDYVVELYLDDTMEDIATGSGRLTVTFEGEGGFLGGLFSGSGDDDFWVRIYSDGWLASDCDRRYTVEVSAY
jgi:hypothetical protein